MAYLLIKKKRIKLTVAENREYKEADNIDFAQSSLKSHPLWVTLYFKPVISRNKIN